MVPVREAKLVALLQDGLGGGKGGVCGGQGRMVGEQLGQDQL